MSEDGIKRRGFGSMKSKNPARLKELASLGGKAAAKEGVSHRFSSKEAEAARVKGLVVRRAKRRV